MNIGDHCAFSECNRLDFLPIKCTACTKNFCSQHYQYKAHKCQKATPLQLESANQFQLPTCPICDQTVSFLDGNRNPDEAISRHIDSGCKNPKKPKSSNLCSKKGCKKKELVPIKCKDCDKVFCLRHRLAEDHSCIGRQNAMRENALKAAENRRKTQTQKNSNRPGPSAGLYPERQIDKKTQEQLDHELAMQLQRSFESSNVGQQRGSNSGTRGDGKKDCTVM